MLPTAHAEQFRKSGERYINHPVAVARIVAELGLDETTVSAALLHDAVEDTAVTLDDVQREFGAEVASIVDGVTKLERIRFDSKEEQQAATMRKMLVAMAKDLRVLIIKLSDRLHNMRTIAAFPEHKQRRTAQETLDIYAPLAHRLGMQEMKQQLEDLAFASLHPKRYAEIDHMVSTRSPERDEYLDSLLDQVRTRLAELRITAEVTGRPKHLWSIYEKMVVKGREFDEIFDLVGIRVIVDTVKDCYAALGSIHATWKPVQGRFKDYIAMPKFNLYQSLHTTVVGPGGKPLEVQIRTREMHQRSEFGVAAHWSYKENTPASDIAWLNRIIDWQQETSDPAQFMENLKTDLDQDEVFVFTPKGRVVTLPRGATPIDFAYSVHTEVGHSCIGARVNGRLVPLDSTLLSGDTCEIFTSKVEGAAPSRDWLKIVVSPRARNKIRQWFSRERREDAIETGREELVKAMRREGLPVQKLLSTDVLEKTAVSMSYHNLEGLYVAIGDNRVSGSAIAQRIGAHPARGRGGDRGAPAGLHPHAAEEQAHRQRGHPRRGPRRRDGAPVAVLHAGAGRRDRRLRHAWSWGLGAPCRLRERGVAVDRPERPSHRRRVGRRGRHGVHRRDRGEGARSLAAAARRVERAVRSARQHHRLLDLDRKRPHLSHAVRVRARRPAASRFGDQHDPPDRQRLRRLSHPAGQGSLTACRRGSNGLASSEASEL